MRRALGCVVMCVALSSTGLSAAAADEPTTSTLPAAAAPAATWHPAGSSRVHAGDAVRIDFDYLDQPDGEPVTEIQVTGRAGATGSVVTLGAGQLLAATARASHGRAVSYPSFDPSPDGPRAIVRVLDDKGRDDLSPKKRDFSFGADFVLDALSSEPGSADDGDNLVQRGLYDDAAQYKLQVDARHPSCRLKGTVKGAPVELEVKSSVEVDDTHWYSAACVRDGKSLAVVVELFNDDGSTTTTTDRTRGNRVIKIAMDPRTVPFSVGGKLYADGSVDTDSDQFNGLVDEVHLSVD